MNPWRQISMTPASRSASAAILLFAAASGQTLADSPKFEVASVKPSVPRPPSAGGMGPRSGGNGVGGGGGCPQRLKIDRTRVDIECATLPMLIGYAFRLPPDRITGPDWMNGLGSPRFNIAAKIAEDASENQVPEMVRALLADRFHLTTHRSKTTQPIYALVVARGGLKVKEAAGIPPLPAAPQPDAPPGTTLFFGETQDRTTPNADGKGETTTISNPRMGTVRETDGPDLLQSRMEAPSITFEGLAELLDKMMPVSTVVVDMTGIKGRYQLAFEVSLKDLPKPDPAAIDSGSERDAAILQRFNDGLGGLGLQLVRRKGPVETLVVDHAEKAPTGN